MTAPTTGLCFTPDGSSLVAVPWQSSNVMIYRVEDGTIMRHFATRGFSDDVAVAANGCIYVSSRNGRHVSMFDPRGEMLSSWDSARDTKDPAIETGDMFGRGTLVLSQNKLYVLSTKASYVQVYTV